ncbi:MAG: YihY/virulence factor BrkB family protein, partial [Candidatus Binataceae bacterium]
MSGSGHRADRPVHIPKRGWWSILKRVYAATGYKNLSIMAAGIAFYGFLTIFPALAALVSIYGLIANPARVQKEISALHGVMPAEAQAIIANQLKSITSAGESKLGISLILGLVIALWSTRAGTVTLIGALNIVYEEEERRSLVWFEMAAMLMTIAG